MDKYFINLKKPENYAMAYSIYPNQITRFPNQIIILQIKSLRVIKSWFKSNRDLDLPSLVVDDQRQK